jgi:hypothetical protein
MLNNTKPISGKPPQVVASGGDYRIILHGGGLYEFQNVKTGQKAAMLESVAAFMLNELARRGWTGDEPVGKYLAENAQACLVQLTELAEDPNNLDEHVREGMADLINRAAAETAQSLSIPDADGRILKSDSIGLFFEWLDQKHAAFMDLDNDVIALTVRDFIRAMEERYGQMWHSYQASKAACEVAEPRMTAPDGEMHQDFVLYGEVAMSDKPVVNAEADPKMELARKLASISHNDKYDVWLAVGLNIFQVFKGHEDGLGLWHEWSKSARNYDANRLDRLWVAFGQQIDDLPTGKK